MDVGLYNVDSKLPNFALMKIFSFHKSKKDNVSWWEPIFSGFDIVYASSIFTFSDKRWVNDNMVCGGSGFDLITGLNLKIENGEPNYSLYPKMDYALGFLTRGCVRKCPECIVPKKEGKLKAYRDIEQIAQDRRNIVLMDNNVLALITD